MSSWRALVVLLCLGAAVGAEARPLALSEAVVAAVARNGDLAVRRLERDAAATEVARQRAAFDPVASGEAARTREDDPVSGAATSDRGELAVRVLLPTGTDLAVTGAGARQEPAFGDAWSARAGVEATQALLRGAGLGTGLAGVRRARIDLAISTWEVHGVALALVAEVEEAYWRLALSERRARIVADALAVAERQAADTAERIRLGRLAAAEQAAADAELAARRQDRLDADAALTTARLRLTSLIGGDDWAVAWTATTPVAAPQDPPAPVADHVALAVRLRADLRQAELARRRGELAVVETRNGLLPRLDLFAGLGRTGYADSFAAAVPGDDGDGSDWRVGIRVEQALGARAERAAARRAEIDARRLDEALANQRRLAEFDVRAAHAEATRAAAAVAARAATARLRAETVRNLTAQQAVGRATALQVAQAERDRLEAELAAADAEVTARTALTTLYRQDGSLLERRGIVVVEVE